MLVGGYFDGFGNDVDIEYGLSCLVDYSYNGEEN